MADELSLVHSEQFRSALAKLLTAFEYAQDSRADPWEFAVEMTELLTLGATLADIRWLILRGFAQHAKETTTPGDAKRSFRPLALTSFPPDACLVLTPVGSQALRSAIKSQSETRQPSPSSVGAGLPTGLQQRPEPRIPSPDPRTPGSPSPSTGEGRGEGASNPLWSGLLTGPQPLPQPPAPSPQPLTPVWDPAHRELRYRGQVVKRYRVPAPNQELILTAFQEEGWPEFIDDPLPPSAGVDSKRRLHDTIVRLNRGHAHHFIRFTGNGNGLAIHWQPIPTGAATDTRAAPA